MLIKNDMMVDEVVQFLVELKTKQKKIESTAKIVYSRLTLYKALKYNILFKNLLLHPLMLMERDFFDGNKNYIETDIELQEEIKKILEYELTSEKESLSIMERTQVIKFFEKLKKKNAS